MKNLFAAGRLLSCVTVLSLVFSAIAEVETLTYIPYSSYLGPTQVSWTDEDGNQVAWKAGSVAVMNPGGSNRGLSFTLDAYKLVVSPGSNARYWWDGGNGALKIGAGGVEFTAPCFWSHINSGLMDKVTLSADQTWRNASSAGTARLALGSKMTWKDNMYNKARISAASGVTAWNLTGDLEVWLYSPVNRLQDVTVTVSDQAKICLVASDDPRLNAKKLVLDGSTMPFDVQLVNDTSSYESRTIGTIDVEHVTDDVELRNGATISVGSATFAIPELKVTGAGNSFTGTGLTLAQATSTVTFTEEGSELDFNVKLSEGAGSSIAVTGPGTVGFVADKDGGYRGVLNLSATSKAKIAGSDVFAADIRGGAGLEIAAQGLVVLSGSIADFTGEEIVVSSGMLLVGAMGGLPAGTSIRTAGEGVVMFATSQGYDPDRVTGTKNVVFAASDDIYVMGDPISADALTLNAGQRLHVYGNGLTADTALTLAGGTVIFHGNATIASPVVVSALTVITTEVASVTGTFAGRYDSQVSSASYGTKIYGDGTVRFAGGGSFPSEPDSVGVLGGEIHFTGGEYAFGSRAILVLTSTGTPDINGNWCKRMLVADGGSVKLADRNGIAIYGYSRTNGAYYFDEAVMEVAEGGTVELEGQSRVQLGGNQAKARILVNGGTWKMGTGRVQFGGSGMGTGVIELNSGVFETGGSFGRTYYTSNSDYQDQGRFIFNGGTLRLLEGDGCRTLFTTWGTSPSPAEEHRDKLRAWMCVDGSDCTIDVAEGLTITNVPPNFERSEWFGHGKLTVTGGGTLVMNAVAEDVDLSLADTGTKVKITDAALVYDDAKCRTTMNVNPYKDKYSTLPQANGYLRDSLAFKTFGLDGMGTSFAVEGTLPVAVTNVQVGASGEWNSSWSVLGDGVTLQDITFAENAVIGASKAADGTLGKVVFPGTMTLPAAMRYCGRQLGGGGSVLSAATVVGPVPAMSPHPDNRAGDAGYDVTDGFWFQPAGSLLLIR